MKTRENLKLAHVYGIGLDAKCKFTFYAVELSISMSEVLYVVCKRIKWRLERSCKSKQDVAA